MLLKIGETAHTLSNIIRTAEAAKTHDMKIIIRVERKGWCGHGTWHYQDTYLKDFILLETQDI